MYGSNARSASRWPRVISTSAARSGLFENVTFATSNLGYAFFTTALIAKRVAARQRHPRDVARPMIKFASLRFKAIVEPARSYASSTMILP